MVLREDYINNRFERARGNLHYLKGLYNDKPDTEVFERLKHAYKEFNEAMRLVWILEDLKRLPTTPDEHCESGFDNFMDHLK